MSESADSSDIASVPAAPDVLAYAPAGQNRNLKSAVIIAGLVSTGLTLLLVWAIKDHTNPMGWYLDFVIPAGAILVGLLASAGYSLVSWIAGVKIRKGLAWTIVALQIIAYFAAQYVAFASQGPLYLVSTGERLTFWKYYHLHTVNMVWESDHSTTPSYGSKKEPEPLGNTGYLVRFGEIVGFVGGSLIVPLSLLMVPYCELCQLYMRTKTLVWIPPERGGDAPPADGAPPGDAVPSEPTPFKPEDATLARLIESATHRQIEVFNQCVAGLRPGSKKASKRSQRCVVKQIRCRCCGNGRLLVQLVTGQGKRQKTEELTRIELERDFLGGIST